MAKATGCKWPHYCKLSLIEFTNLTNFLATHCSLKLELEKLATEKAEMQRHYVMVRGRTADQH